MPNIQKLEQAMPVAPIKLIATKSMETMAKNINQYLVEFRRDLNNKFKNDPAFHGYMEDDYLLPVSCPRFGSGEGKAVLQDSARGKDVFILVDVTNHSITYKMNGFINYEQMKKMNKRANRVFNLPENSKIKSNILKYKKDYQGLHPTQKPIALLEDLIKTYSNENDVILDNCMGSGSTGVACVNTNRNFIGIELDDTYFDIASKRIYDCNKDGGN